MIKYIILAIIIGILIGIYLDRKLFKEEKEMTTYDLLFELQKRNYWVRIGPKENK